MILKVKSSSVCFFKRVYENKTFIILFHYSLITLKISMF